MYYGRPSAAANGTAIFTVPAGLAAGSYTIKIFNEEVNGDKQTDFASTPVSIALMLDNSEPTIASVTPNVQACPSARTCCR